MKKIMFSDEYSLTQAALEGRKTQTRRIVKNVDLVQYLNELEEDDALQGIRGNIAAVENALYEVGEIVAIAQSYENIMKEDSEHRVLGHPTVLEQNASDTAEWDNKMFVKARSMPHHIRITNVRVERLQDISEEDCIAEGIYKRDDVLEANLEEVTVYTFPNSIFNWLNPRKAFSELIDKVSGKGTWDSNPYVFVYEFELID